MNFFYHMLGIMPQEPREAREQYCRAHYLYTQERETRLDECRTARLMARTSGRRLCPLYLKDLKRAQRDMVLSRAVYYRAAP